MVEIVYWSGTGNTEAMANEIEAAVKAAGADVESVRFEDTNVDDVASKDVILLGCPAMGSEELEDSVVEPFFTDLAPKLKGKKVGLLVLTAGVPANGWTHGNSVQKMPVPPSLVRPSSTKHRTTLLNAKNWAKPLPKHKNQKTTSHSFSS